MTPFARESGAVALLLHGVSRITLAPGTTAWYSEPALPADGAGWGCSICPAWEWFGEEGAPELYARRLARSHRCTAASGSARMSA